MCAFACLFALPHFGLLTWVRAYVGVAMCLSPEGDVDEEHLRRRVCNVVRAAKRRGVNVKTEFQHYDWQNRSRIGRLEFQRALERAGFLLTQGEALHLANKFDSGTGNAVLYKEFLKWCEVETVNVDVVADKLRYYVNMSAKEQGGKRPDFKPAFARPSPSFPFFCGNIRSQGNAQCFG